MRLATTFLATTMGTETTTDAEAEDVRRKWGLAIRQQRQFLKMTQVQLAEALGVDQTSVSQWEMGRTAPGPDRQLAIAPVLKCDARVLFAYPDAA